MVSRRLTRLALTLSACLSAACLSIPVAGAAGKTTLKFASWDPAAVTDAYLKPCATKLGINITNQMVPNSTYGTKTSTEFAAGTAPDVFYATENNVLQWGAAGELLNQAPFYKSVHVAVDNILPQAQWWNHGKPGTQLVGVNGAVEDMFMYYNKNVFQQAGVAAPPSDAAHAWTWDQFVAVAEKLTVDRHGKHPGQSGFDPKHIVRYGVNVGDGWDTLLPFVYSNGGTPFDSSYTHFTLDQPAAAAAVQAVADLTVKYHVAPTPVQIANTGSNLTLASGRIAMDVSGNWDIYFQQNPTKTYPMGIGVLPKLKTYKTIVVGGPVVVWSHTKYPQQAMKLMYCISQNGKALWQNGIWMPTTKNWYAGSALTSWATTPAHPSNYTSVAVDTLKYAESPPEIKTSQFNSAWTDVVAPALDQIFEGRKTASSALSGIKSRVDAILAQGR